MDSVVSSLNMESLDSAKSPAASDQLRNLLAQLDNSGSPSSLLRLSTSPEVYQEVFQSNELSVLLQATDEITHRLRHENSALRDDNTKLRSNMAILIEENNRLHQELQSTFISDMLRMINVDVGGQTTDNESHIVDVYTKKLRSLEIELKDTKEKLSMYDNIWYAANDLAHCLKCGALLPFGQHASEQSEKFVDIMAENEANKHRLQQIQGKLEQGQEKERETLKKLQQAVALTEQCRLEKTEAIKECDRIKTELVDTQRRLRNLIDEMNEKITNEKQNIEATCQAQLEENAEIVKQIEKRCQQHELTIDRLIREKNSLAADLNVWKERIQREEIDLSQAADFVKLKIQKAMRERDQANNNTMQIRSDYEKLLSESTQNLAQVRHQLSSTQNRLNDMESELLQSKKQCLDLTEDINHLTRENITLKSLKQNLEKSREENLNAIVVILNQREQEYHTIIENLELERTQSLADLEKLVLNQSKVLNKLRSYSRKLTNDIQKIIEEKDAAIQEVTVENQALQIKLSNAYKRLEDIDSQLLHHNDTHIKLNQRVVHLNQKVKNYENIINKIKTQDLIEYKNKFELESEQN